MGQRGETYAKAFEAKAEEAARFIESLTDDEWKKTTTAEKWSVGVTAHHIAVSHELLAGLAKTLADGKPGPNIPVDALHQANAKHAQEHANCTKAETLALFRRGAAAAASIVRGIADADLDRRGAVIAGMPEMSAADLAGGLLVRHIDEHLGSIRATVGR
ncbi:MAG TPA: DinB family protein [Candidatus Tectomicrobia bacterium]|nr:DinB family protein [Candidatus Tectomicrobia bacterium]